VRWAAKALVAVLLGVAGMTACGGASTGPKLAAFVDLADGICGRANAAITAATKPSDMASLATYANVLADQADSQARQLRALKQPGKARDRAAVKAFEDTLAAIVVPARQLQLLAAGEKVSAISDTASKTSAAARAADAKTAEIGFAQCGTGERDSALVIDANAPTVAKGTYIAKANAICARISRVAPVLPPTATLTQRADALTKALPDVDQALAELKALEKPVGDRTYLDAFLTLQDEEAALVREIADALRRGDRTVVVNLLSQLLTRSQESDAKADAYGMKQCGSGS
jgi:hypothetical protein